jgi:flavin reductase (DIM6/NTAB) family NADH-FMN oxidoreductase RutF
VDRFSEARAVLARVDPVLWVVTARAGGHQSGLVATFVSEASIVPEAPRVVVGLARQHYTWGLVEASGALALHQLGESQLDWVWRFGLATGREVDKLAGLEWHPGVTGAPILAGAVGWLDCRVEERMDTGDRTVYLAAVEAGGGSGEGPVLTVRSVLAAAGPAERGRLQALLDQDIQTDRSAIQAWRQGPRPSSA